MALLHVNFYSRTLERETQMDVILPEAAKKLIGMEGVATRQCKTLYLLHGMSDDQTIWQRRTSIERYAAAYGLAVVMPTTDLGWYTDMYRGDKYFAFITRELPAVCRRMFGLGAAREQNYIFGLSMGGYGAMKCALTYPGRYAGAASFSGVCDLRRTVERRSISLHESEIAAIFGEEKAVPPKDDLFVLAERLSGEAPGLYLSCGEQDGLYAANERFSAHLASLSLAHRFDHWPGAHTWDFWDTSLRAALAYFFD